ncbi:MAG: undecaprenyl-diphosphate phosphatase [Clostridiales bacterium]|nr:undecaprenyl-diphosphate phosphatase [Clostridiales bacterium]
MDILQAIFLGLVQGLTEFLPVSSSGHLVAFQQILGIEEVGATNLTFDVALHLGTLVAVFVFYWQDIRLMVNEIFLWMGELIGLKKARSAPYDKGHRVMAQMLIVATIPTAILGFLFNDLFEKMFSSTYIIGFALLITGTLLWISNRMVKGHKQPGDITPRDAVAIGLLQGMAITPGISRSGTTIFAGMIRGFTVELATKFSFLLSIPAIMGAAVLEGIKIMKSGVRFTDSLPMVTGFIVAAVTGYFAIKFLVDLINRKKLYYFSYYCWGAGIFILLYTLVFIR